MLREDLMNPDLFSEIVLLGSAALIVVAFLLMVVAAFTQPGYPDELKSLNQVLDGSPRVRVSDVISSTLQKTGIAVAA